MIFADVEEREKAKILIAKSASNANRSIDLTIRTLVPVHN